MTYPRDRRLDRTVLFTPDGIEYALDGGGRWILQDGEYGNPPMEYVTQRGPFQHGESVIDVWLRPRPIQLILRYVGGSRVDYWNHRAELLNMLRPNRSTNLYLSQHRLRKHLANGYDREILVVPDATPTFPAPDQGTWDAFGFTDVLRFVANDPLWYDPNERSATFETVTDYVSVDFPPGYTLHSGDYLKVANAEVRGTWLSYPIITFTGPLNDPTIYNSSTGQIISSTLHIANGDQLILDLRYGYKTVKNQDGDSNIGTITTDSNLVDFHMAPSPEVADGMNVLYVTGTGQSGATNVSVTWFDKFIGI